MASRRVPPSRSRAPAPAPPRRSNSNSTTTRKPFSSANPKSVSSSAAFGSAPTRPSPSASLAPPLPGRSDSNGEGYGESNGGEGSPSRDRHQTTSMRYSVQSLMQMIAKQDQDKGDRLAKLQKELHDLKLEIALASKKNYKMEEGIRVLDQKIALLIHNRISLEEVLSSSGDLSNLNKVTVLKDKAERQRYGQLFYLLQQDTIYLSRLAQLVKLGEIDNLLQTVMFTLYGNQYDESEEHLLLSMFQTVLHDEFANAKSISGILRANTAITRMMTTYTRRDPGQQYLKHTLTGILIQVTSCPEMSLEINPLKVYEQMVNDYETTTGKVWEGERKPDQDVAKEDSRVKELCKDRMHKIGELVDKMIDTLIASVDKVPYGIRWICKQIRELCRSHFPMATREQCCSMIGGFFLLRYVNPAVVSPQAFMLVNEKLSNYTRRNLTVLAKVMQNLANNVTFGGVKEYFMEPLNKVLSRNRDRVNRFLEELTNVAELEEHLNLDKYIALGRAEEPSINITLNEMYSVHGLLQEHLAAVTPQEADRDHTALTKLMHELGSAPALVPRSENASVDLKLDKRIKGADSAIETADQVYAETKYLMFIVLKSMRDVSSIADMSTLLSQAAKQARDHNNMALLESVSRIKENCQILEREGKVSAEDDYAQLRRDAMGEMSNYESMLQKTQSDHERLRQVLRNIHDRYSWMEEQYDAYKEYLSNVRQNCNRTPQKGKKAKQEEKVKTKKKKSERRTFKYSHKQLEADGIIMESEVPEGPRGSIFFAFSSSQPGIFDVTVMFKSRHIAKITLHLDDLLEKQHNGQIEFETDFLKLNVNLLIHLLNQNFVS